MVTRNGQPAEHTVPGFAGRLTRGELDAYDSAFKAIRSDFAELEKLQTQVNRLARIRWDHPASLRHFTSLKTADGTQWDAYGILLKAANSEVLLCRKAEGTEWAAIQRLSTDGPYARGHGTTEVLVNGDDARAVTTEYASPGTAHIAIHGQQPHGTRAESGLGTVPRPQSEACGACPLRAVLRGTQ